MTREDAGLEGPTADRFSEALAKQEEIFRDSFPGMLGVRVLEVSDGYAKAAIEVDHRVKHPGGSAHGGALAGFGDTCAAWATFPSLADGEIFTTIEFKANFIAGVSEGTLIGEARAIHRGRRTMLIEVKISTAEAEPRLVCVMLVTQAILQPRSPEEPSRY
jgi:1,4-dihydroxy-2-naphthoyl-CoA hydrolase